MVSMKNEKRTIETLYDFFERHEQQDRDDKKELIDRMEQFVIAIKDNPGSSHILLDIQEKLKILNEWQERWTPTLEEADKIIKGGAFTKKAFFFLVSFLAGISIIVGSIIAFKEWIKR